MSDLAAEDVPPMLARILARAPQPDQRPNTDQLAGWLSGLVRSRDYGALADLRRITAPRRPARDDDRRPRTAGRAAGIDRKPVTEAALRAADYAPKEELRVVYQQVAFLFARYHQGPATAHYGFGNVGSAVRRIGTGAVRGPKNPGAVLLIERLTTSRDIPWRFLQHAVERVRACDTAPPSWSQLAQDLTDWHSRVRDIPESWARSFFTPTFPAKKADAP